MQQPFLFDGMQVSATTSIGITVCMPRETGIDGKQLLDRADHALYQAKAAGRNTFKALLDV